MTLMELLNTMATQGSISASRVKDVKTSIRYLARALGKDTPEQCQEVDFLLPRTAWKEKLDRYFLEQQQQGKTISSHTLRNTRQNLSFLFRTAQRSGVLTTPQSLPQAFCSVVEAITLMRQTSPFAQHSQAANAIRYHLAFEQWPSDIQTTWLSYCDSRRLRVRQTTLRRNQDLLTSYIGFLINVEGYSIHWDDLFDITTLDRFVRWHSQRLHVRLSTGAKATVEILRTLAYRLNHPALTAIKDYCRDLPVPEPMHDKQRNSLTLQDLETVALAVLQNAYKPLTTFDKRAKHPGLSSTLSHQRALMLRILVRIPLRSRNLREIQLEKNLYKDDARHWHLHFSGEELKIGTRNGRTNTYHVDLTDYCSDILPHLEEFLTIYRLRIPNAANSPFLFLTRFGHPFTDRALNAQLSLAVFRLIKKRFYTHQIRTIWATEFVTTTGRFDTAAHMLGDTVQVVLQRYHEMIEHEHKNMARSFLTAALR
jgi:site-specific recombinase XerC